MPPLRLNCSVQEQTFQTRNKALQEWKPKAERAKTSFQTQNLLCKNFDKQIEEYTNKVNILSQDRKKCRRTAGTA